MEKLGISLTKNSKSAMIYLLSIGGSISITMDIGPTYSGASIDNWLDESDMIYEVGYIT